MVIYPKAVEGYDLLAIMSMSLIFSALSQTMSGALQGIGKVFVPAISILAGCVVKVILNIILIRQPSINIYGAAISSIACQATAFLISFIVLSKYVSLKMSISKYVIKPLIAGGIMGITAWAAYKLFMAVIGSNIVSTLLAIAFAAAVYLILVLALKILSENEIKMLPGGNAIYRLLERAKIYS